MTQLLFSSTLFFASALLFWSELLTSKLLVPILGGSASVWTTCLMFFQTALLLGYLLAVVLNRQTQRPFRRFLFPLLILIAGSMLPISPDRFIPPSPDTNPILWLLKILPAMIGAPFVALAVSAPLLQAWYARTQTKNALDPYFLYAASNLGSLAALAAYPTLLEPQFTLTMQSQLWTAGYFTFAALAGLCALVAIPLPNKNQATPAPTMAAPNLAARLKWLALAFAPSSLLLGVTTHLTTDVAAVPLFWALPLMLYLLSFVLAFQRLTDIPTRIVSALQAGFATLLAISLMSDFRDLFSIFGLHLLTFFLTALLCHQSLARLRPSATYVTEFYLFLAFGGALGGIFNALLAPILFNDVIEYPLVFSVACLLRPGALPSLSASLLTALTDIALPALVFSLLVLPNQYALVPIGLAVLVLVPLRHRAPRALFAATALAFAGFVFANVGHLTSHLQGIYKVIRMAVMDPSPLSLFHNPAAVVLVGIIGLAVFSFRQRSIRFGLSITAIALAGFIVTKPGNVLAKVRNFYGTLTVYANGDPPVHVLYDGTTLHGLQSQDPDHRLQPSVYYHPLGPLGQLFTSLLNTPLTQHVALVGLGAGVLSCYEKPGAHWTYFELNPAVVAVASDPTLFSYLRDCPAHPDIKQGDARLLLAQEPDNSYDMIIIDAFSSDMIPVHLLTREALQLYMRKLHFDGLLVFNATNRYLNLVPVLSDTASSLHLQARYWHDAARADAALNPFAQNRRNAIIPDKLDTDWIIVTKDFETIPQLRDDHRWNSLLPSSDQQVWSDDHSNLLQAFRW